MVKVGANGQPISLYIELLVVTDSTVFDYHKNFIGSNDQNLIFSQMRIYYAHLINGVSFYQKILPILIQTNKKRLTDDSQIHS